MPPKKTTTDPVSGSDGAKKKTPVSGSDGAKKAATKGNDAKKTTTGGDSTKKAATKGDAAKKTTTGGDGAKKTATKGNDGKKATDSAKKASTKGIDAKKATTGGDDAKKTATKGNDAKKATTKANGDGAKKGTDKKKAAAGAALKETKEKNVKDAAPAADGSVAGAPEKKKTVKKVGAKKVGLKGIKTGVKGKKANVAKKRKLNKNDLHAKKLKLMRKRRFIKFVLKCSEQAKDQVLDVKKLEKFLRDRIKVNEKTHNLSKKVKTKLKDNDVIVLAKPPFAKRYLKYLTRKFLKKNALRDWIRIVAAGSNNYRLSYYKIENPDEEEEKKTE